MDIKNKYLNKMYKNYSVLLCNSLNIKKDIIMKSLDDILSSNIEKIILDKSFFECNIKNLRMKKLDFNNLQEQILEIFNDKKIEFIIVGADDLHYTLVFKITDLAIENNKKVLILIKNRAPGLIEYKDDEKNTKAKVKAIIEDLIGREKNFKIINKERLINAKY